MKVLIIDDEYSTREKYYSKVFKDFQITSVDKTKSLQNISYKDFKLIAIDLYLWNQTPNDAKNIISGIPSTIPIILISQRWNDSNGVPIEDIYTYTANKQVIKLISFQRIIEAASEDVDKICREYNAEIIIELNSFYQYNNIPIKDSDTINILHIADMQFGGSISDSADFDIYTIKDFLKNNFLGPDIVLVAGDIAQKGLADEYQEAILWFDDLKANLFDKGNVENRFIVTPGNHDANFNLFSGFILHYDFEKKCFNIPFECMKNDDSTGKQVVVYNKNNYNKENIDKIIYNDFMRFAYNLTGDSRWLLTPNHFNLYINNFENLGLRILSINSNVNISASDKTDKKDILHRGAGIDKKACERLLETLNEDKMFTIVLSHMGPNDLGKDNEDLNEQWKTARNFFDSVKTDLWLCGHNHVNKSAVIDDECARYIYNKPYVHAGSLRLGSSALPDGARRSFNVIQLVRDKAIVKSIRVIPCEINNNNIERKKEKIYVVNEL